MRNGNTHIYLHLKVTHVQTAYVPEESFGKD
jgi:hypothetical protein